MGQGDWLQRPHFAQSGNLLFLIVTNDNERAARITAALQ
jgi:hypothetical protein